MEKEQPNHSLNIFTGLVTGLALMITVADRLKPRTLCNHCEQKGTNYMTACCHKPICYSCFLSHRKYKSSGYPRLGVRKSSYWGDSIFTCPFCGRRKEVADLDPDSVAAMYQDKDISFVVRIGNPEERGYWI